MFHAQVSELTASGDATKTLIDTIRVPMSAKKIIGLWAQGFAGATMTSGEPISGFVEFESPDTDIQPCQLPLDIIDPLTGGVAAMPAHIIPTDIPIKNPGAAINGYITMDMAMTGALQARFGVITE